MLPRPVAVIAALLALAALSGCAERTRQIRTNALDYLYPQGASARPALDVTLRLPVRVGIAFAPGPARGDNPFSEDQKRRLLERVAQSFRGRDGIAGVDVIPSSQLHAGGGFDELDRIRQAYGLDLVALVSYDQFQFSETTRASWTYWTLVGAYLVKGEKNETRTVLDAVIFDLPSRAMLFSASGDSSIGGKSTPIDVSKELRGASEQGFELAVDALIPRLDAALAAFQEQARQGTVRGPGTPSVALVETPGGSAGSFGAFEILAAALLWAGATASNRRA